MNEGKTKKLSLKAIFICVLACIFVAAACVIAYAALSKTPALQIKVTDRDGVQRTIMSWYYDEESGTYYDENGKSLEELGLIDSACTQDSPYYYSGIWKEANNAVACATAVSGVRVSALLDYCCSIDETAKSIIETKSSSVELRFKGSEATSPTTTSAWDTYGGIDEWKKTRYYNKDSYTNAKAGIEVPTILALKSALEKNTSEPPAASQATETGIRLLQGQLGTVTSLATATEYRNMSMWTDKTLTHRNEGTCNNVSVIEITPTYYPVRVAGGKIAEEAEEGEDGYASKVVGATIIPDDHYFSSLTDMQYGFNVELKNTYDLHSVYFNGEQIQADSVTDNIYHFTVKAEAIDTGNKLVVNTRRNEGEQGTLYLDDVEGASFSVKSGGVSLSNGSAIEEGMTLEFSCKLNEGYSFLNYTVNGQDWKDDSYVVTAADVAADTSLHVGMKLEAKKVTLHIEKEAANLAGLSTKPTTDCEFNVTYKDANTGETVQVNDGDLVPVGSELNIDAKAPKGFYVANNGLQLKYYKEEKLCAKYINPLNLPDGAASGTEKYNRERVATYKLTAEDSTYDNTELFLRMSINPQNFDITNVTGESQQGSLKIYASRGSQTRQFGENGTDTRIRTVDIGSNVELSAVPAAGYEIDYFYYKVANSSKLDGTEEEHKLDANYSTDDYQASIKIDPAQLDDEGNYWFIGCVFKESSAQQTINIAQPQHGKISITCGDASVESGVKLPVSSILKFKTECDAGYILDSYEVKAIASDGTQYLCKVASGNDYVVKSGYDQYAGKNVSQKGRACGSTYQLVQGFDSVEIMPVFRERKALTIKAITAADAHAGGFDYKLIRSGIAKNVQGEYEDVADQVVFDSAADSTQDAQNLVVYEGNTLSAKVTLLDGINPADSSQEFIDTYSVLFKTAADKYGNETITLTGDETDITLNIARDTQYITWDNDADTSWYSSDEQEFTLTTPQQLAGFSKLVNAGNSFKGKKVCLGADIDMCGNIENYPRLYISIGTVDTPFEGTFDGFNHSVTFYDKNGTSGQTSRANATTPNFGLFGYTNGAAISNVIIKGIVKRYYVNNDTRGCGGIVGSMNGGSITNCINEAEIATTMSNVGGIVGTIVGGQAYISKCINKGKVYYYPKTSTIVAQQYFGGIVGLIDDAQKDTIENCINYGDVLYCGSYSGGICGGINDKGNIDQVSFINSYCTGSVFGGTGIGGIVGNVRSYNSRTSIDGIAGVKINSCYFSGILTSGSESQGGEFVGGAIGNDGLYIPIEITKSYYLKGNGIQVTYWVGPTTAAAEYSPVSAGLSGLSDYETWNIPAQSVAECSLDVLKTKSADLGSAYATDTYGVNNESNNTPILTWQNPGASSVFCQACKNGKISVANSTYEQGEAVSVEVNPSSGYRMSSIKAMDYDGNEVKLECEQEGARYSFTMPKSTVILSATFAKIYNISLGEDIQNGTLEPQVADAIAGQVVTVNVKPKDYCVLDTIECVSSNAQDIELTTIEDGLTYSFVMPQDDVTLAATFEKVFSVIVKSAENGSIAINRNGAREGNIIRITANPNSGYVLDSLKIVDMKNNKYTAQEQADGTYTFEMPASSVQITPSFVKEQVKPVPTPTPVAKISVAKVKLKFAKSLKKAKLTLKWKKISGINGYQIYYKQAGKKAKYKKVKASSKKKTLVKLKRGKKYKVKIRAYKVQGGKTYFGKWSNSKKVTIKKK